MVLTGCAVFPHGAMPFDGDVDIPSDAALQRFANLEFEETEKLTKLYEGCCLAARQVAAMDPEVIVIHTPHGISLSGSAGVYLNTTASGSAEWLGQWKEYTVEVHCAVDMAHAIVNHLKSNSCPAEGIMCYSNYNTPILHWGEAIPIWYLTRALGEKAKSVKYIFMSSPRPQLASLYMETMKRGGALYEYLEEQKQRIVFAVSGDLSHAYETNCTEPMYLPDPRSNFMADDVAAKSFETAAKSWARGQQESGLDTLAWDPVKAETFLKLCNELQLKAGSCGIGGFIVLHGLMNACIETGGSILSPSLIMCEAPTYYGMMAVVYKRMKSI